MKTCLQIATREKDLVKWHGSLKLFIDVGKKEKCYFIVHTCMAYLSDTVYILAIVLC